ncbi:MAG: hypothetical protein IJ250_00090 [Bacteroidales bacterium]|nr:hypothetical protein [Bacteroidales bacterium]
MAKSELVLMEDAKNCTLYTIQFLSDNVTEFEKFYNKFVDSKEFNADLMRIVSFIDRIADFGALERFFRPEGKMNDNVVALPVVSSKLRLYCLRLSDKILIIGNGGSKKVRKYQEDKELNGYVVTLQNFDKLIKEGIKDGAIEVTENKIITNKIFEI